MLDAGLYEVSARRLALIRRIPPYVAFGLRTEDEARAIALHHEQVRAPEVPAEVLSLAAEVEPLEDERVGLLHACELPVCDRAPGRLLGTIGCKLTVMDQAR